MQKIKRPLNSQVRYTPLNVIAAGVPNRIHLLETGSGKNAPGK